MPRRLTNDLLLVLLLAQVLGGVLGWALRVDTAAPLYDLHRALGIGVIVLLGWKQAIAYNSLQRRLRRRPWDPSILWGCLAAIAVLAALALGLAWTLNLITFDLLWGYSPLNVHVILGIGLLPLVGWHMRSRRRQNGLSAPVRSRRSLLRLTGLALATLTGWQAIERLAPPVRLSTGSKHAASFSANAFPAEIWLLDGVPSIDAGQWRLEVSGSTSASMSLAELFARYPRRQVQCILDCTSGWWSEQVWSGVGLVDVLGMVGPGAGARQVAVESVTGHRIVFGLEDLQGAVLATHVGNEPLAPEHGFPVRLVVPGWRGYHWVKWVQRVDVS